MSSLPTFAGQYMPALERAESSPSANMRLPYEANGLSSVPVSNTVPVPVVSGHHHQYSVPQYNASPAFGYTTPFAVPYYSGAPAYGPSTPGMTDMMIPNSNPNGQANGFSPAFATGFAPSPSQYSFNMLPTLPPRYSMSGTPLQDSSRGCISPLDLFSSPHPSQPNFSLVPSPGQGHPQLHIQTGLPSFHSTPSAGLGLGLAVGLTAPDTPVESESVPDTNLASPCSSSSDLEEEKEDEEEDDVMAEEEKAEVDAVPVVKIEKVKLKVPKSPLKNKSLEVNVIEEGAEAGEGAPVVKKRSRTAQACERCRIRKARCFGGNPCNRCIKRKFVCEFTPTRARAAIKPEPKPKARRHSMHTVRPTVQPQPHVNGTIMSATSRIPLGRVHSHTASLGGSSRGAASAAGQPYIRPALPHSQSATPSISASGPTSVLPSPAHPHPSSGFPIGYAAPPQTGTTQFAYTHAHTHSMGQIPLPTVVGASPALVSQPLGMYSYNPLPYGQAYGTPSLVIPQQPAPSTSGIDSVYSSSLGLSLGTHLTTSMPNDVNAGMSSLGLDLSPTHDSNSNGDSPQSASASDVPGLSMSSTSFSSGESGNGASNTMPANSAWSSLLDTSTLPMVDDEMFPFSPIMENDGVYVVGWDEPPSPVELGLAGQYSSAAEQLENVRDAATRQLYGANATGMGGGVPEWYGTTTASY